MPRQPKEPSQPKRKKSSYGSGSVYQRKSDGRYVACIKDPNSGKIIERYAGTEKEARKKLEDIKFEIRQNTLATGPKQTVQQFLERWFEDVHKQQVRESTYYNHNLTLRKHLLPTIGHFQLQQLTALHVQKLYADKIKEGLSPNTVHIIHAILHHALKDALRWKLVSQNVCDAVSLPTQVEPENAVLTLEQVVQLLRAVKDQPLEAFVNLAMTGMRHGEMLALRWEDIDIENRLLQVRRTVVYMEGRYVVGDPKTKKSKRDVMLPMFVVESLLRHKDTQREVCSIAGDQWQANDLVFCDDIGGFVNPNSTRWRFYKLLKSVGLPQVRIHDLRHTASTLLQLEMNEPEKLVQELLGHEKAEMTRERYTHVQSKMLRRMMDNMDAFFKGIL